MSRWPMIALGELLRQVVDSHPVHGNQTYPNFGIYSFGRGLFSKPSISGATTSAKTLCRARKGQFIYSRLFAFEGAYGLVNEEFDGYFVSNEYPMFTCDQERLFAEYLALYFRTPRVWDEVSHLSMGMGDRRRRIQPEQFLTHRIPLPTLDEQRRLVARIDHLASKSREASTIRQQSAQETVYFKSSSLRSVFRAEAHWQQVELRNVLLGITDCLHSNPVYSDEGIPTLRSPDIGWGKLLLGAARKTSEEEYQRRTIRGAPTAGDIIVVREGGGTGKAGMVEPDQRFSLGQRVMMLRANPDIIEPEFLLYQWLSPLVFDEQIMSKMKGSASPHLNINATKHFRIGLPSLIEQRNIIVKVNYL